jgi:hypothetical protein
MKRNAAVTPSLERLIVGRAQPRAVAKIAGESPLRFRVEMVSLFASQVGVFHLTQIQFL